MSEKPAEGPPTGALYGAIQEAHGTSWPRWRCPHTHYEHGMHIWSLEPGDGFRYHYWCNGEGLDEQR